MIIAIDGPAASGKGTLARGLAAALGFAHLDTGMIYRAVAARVLAAGQDPQDAAAALQAAQALEADDLRRSDLRRQEVGQGASVVAAIPEVRAALLAFQREFAAHPPEGRSGAVLDGRDVGTVVCPQAEVKFFITASPEVRARRRHKELLDGGGQSIYARVLQEVQDRDARDSGREAAPLRPAEDAIVLDTTELSVEEALAAALAHIRSRPSAPAL